MNGWDTFEENDWRYYQTDKLAVCPYMPGTPVYADGVLPDLYKRTKDEGKIEEVFCGDVLNMDAFVNFFFTRKTMQVLCEVSANKDIKPIGYSWCDVPRGVDGARAVMTGFCFFDGASDPHNARDLARLGIAYWIQGMKIDVLHGVQLESNVAAKNFAHRLGFEHCATVPDYHYDARVGELVAATVMILRAVDFLPKFEEWKAAQKSSI